MKKFLLKAMGVLAVIAVIGFITWFFYPLAVFMAVIFLILLVFVLAYVLIYAVGNLRRIERIVRADGQRLHTIERLLREARQSAYKEPMDQQAYEHCKVKLREICTVIEDHNAFYSSQIAKSLDRYNIDRIKDGYSFRDMARDMVIDVGSQVLEYFEWNRSAALILYNG